MREWKDYDGFLKVLYQVFSAKLEISSGFDNLNKIATLLPTQLPLNFPL